MKILLATDGAPESTLALQAAGRLLQKQAHQVDVICVMPSWPATRKTTATFAAEDRAEYEKLIARAGHQILDAACDTLRAEGITATPLLKTGSPTSEIVRLADEYDLTVVGARGRAASGTMGLGPVASRVVESAAGAILVARELAADKRLRILIGVDGSAAVQRALVRLTEGFDIQQAEITLLHVMETPWVQFGVDQEWRALSDGSPSATRWRQELRHEAEDLIEDARQQLQGHSVTINPIIAEGNAATAMLEELESSEYDLVVVGASRRREVKQQVLGSVSAKLVWHSPCSVLVVKG